MVIEYRYIQSKEAWALKVCLDRQRAITQDHPSYLSTMLDASAKLCISRTGQASGIRSRMARCHCGDDAPKNRQSRSVNYENKAFIAYWMSRRMGTPIAATRAPTLGTMYFTLKHGCISIYLHVHSSQSLSLASSITSWISRCYGPNLG